jgi:hypothetical protein
MQLDECSKCFEFVVICFNLESMYVNIVGMNMLRLCYTFFIH